MCPKKKLDATNVLCTMRADGCTHDQSATEESFLEILIASERVEVWLDIIKHRGFG